MGRLLHTMFGLVAVAAGIAGLFVPLLPTVPFLLLAAYCFGRGSPALERWLLEHRRFGPHIVAWRERRAITRNGRRAALLAFAASAGLGLTLLSWPWSGLPLLAALIGSAWIARLPVEE